MLEPAKRSNSNAATVALQMAEEALALHSETHKLVKDLHQALMLPQPGYERTLISRITEVVLEAEAGKIVGTRLVFYAKVFAALVAIGTALGISTTIGGSR